MRYEIIVEWFDTKTERDRMAHYAGAGTIDEAKSRARWYLIDRNRNGCIPEVCRVEDNEENVVAVYDWDDATSQPILREESK